jgi:hypothetical protein
MDQKAATAIIDDMKRFFGFARELNDFVARRVSQSGRLKEMYNNARQLGETITTKVGQVLKANLTLREQLTTIYHVCQVLNNNLEKQKEAIGRLNSEEKIDQKIEKRLMYKLLMFSESLQKALLLLQRIIERNNGIILMDHRIERHNAINVVSTKGFFDMVVRLSEIANGDRGVYGSKAGKRDFSDNFISRAADTVKSEDAKSLSVLLDEVKGELTIEEAVSANLMPREQIMEIRGKALALYHRSKEIKSLIDDKNVLHRENLEDMAQLSVILALEIDDVKKIREIFDPSRYGDNDQAEICLLFENLGILFDLAAESIEDLVELNSYMIEIFDSNAKRAEQVLALSVDYSEGYNSIWNDLDEMGKSYGTISDGLRKNLIIGHILEKNLMKAFGNIR